MIVLASDYVGYKIVEHLLNSNEPISFLVLTDTDKGGYNNKIISTYLSAQKNGTIYYQDKLSDDTFLDLVAKSNPKIGILAWWPHILKGKILSIPKIGWVNFHPGFLPFNKGKHPNFWCLVDETKCGVSLQFIDEGIDTGDIIARKEIEVSWEDNGKTVYEKSREAIIELFKNTFNDIKEDRIARIKQLPNEGTYHKSTEIDESSKIELNENYSARKLLNIIRARMFPPHPTAFFYDNGKKYSVEINIKEIKDEHK